MRAGTAPARFGIGSASAGPERHRQGDEHIDTTTTFTAAGRAATTRGARERAELQRQGAKAALRGEGAETNPLLHPVNAPAATGECARHWALRRDAWQAGFEAQRRLRRRGKVA